MGGIDPIVSAGEEGDLRGTVTPLGSEMKRMEFAVLWLVSSGGFSPY